uniref:Elongation factor 1-gamma n=1 Tax=Kalanchoe fedtschenkoi TaxID=63787 RepID=A0A7N0UW53_KALFE
MNPLPLHFIKGHPIDLPSRLLGHRQLIINGVVTQQYLIQWAGEPLDQATWENAEEFLAAYSNFNLEDKVTPEGGGKDACTKVGKGVREIKGSSNNYGRIEQWIDFASLEIDDNLLRWFIPRMRVSLYLPPVEEAEIAALKKALSVLNSYLASNTYLVGHSVTLADIIMTCNLYFWTLANQQNFRKVFGEVKQVETAPPIAKKPEQHKESAKPKPKKEAKKVKKPKELKPATEEEAPKPKPKNPLDLLPPSLMVLDDWKRLYSNTKTNFREVAIKGFWDMYDPERYSLWFCDYKYNDENTVSFVTLNKFEGSCSAWTWRVITRLARCSLSGQSRHTRRSRSSSWTSACYDMELYKWRKVAVSDREQKKRVSQMIEDHEPFEGEALLDAKCFK